MPHPSSGAAHLLRGLSSCGYPIVRDALRQHEAAVVIQRHWKQQLHRPDQEPSPKKKRYYVMTTVTKKCHYLQHWFWGSVRSCNRPERAAAVSLMLRELRESNDISLKVRFIRIWISYEHNEYYVMEWVAILREVIFMLPDDDILAVCRCLVWPRLCRLAATTSDWNAVAAYASLGTALTLQSDTAERKDATVLRNKELLWKNEEAYTDLLRAWNSFPDLFGSLVDPETACHVLQETTIAVEEMCDEMLEGKTDDVDMSSDCSDHYEDHGEVPVNNDAEEHAVAAVEEHENHKDQEDGDESCGEDPDEDDDDDDDDDDDNDVDDLSSGGSGEDVLVEADDLQDIALRGSEVNTGEQGANEEVKKERHEFMIRAGMKVLRGMYSEALLQELLDLVKPPSKPSQTKVLLRRAPTQEEYFRGSIAHNPVDIDMLDSPDPTVEDLRKFIAKELQMADSVELIEVLVANQILSPTLKLRLVHQVLWKQHLIDGNGSGPVFSSGSISILWTTNRRVTVNTPVSALPPMVATYRLIGVDGEATEDTVDRLQDPEETAVGPSEEELEALRRIDPSIVLRCTDTALKNMLIQIQRDQVDGGPASGEMIPSALALLNQCCAVHSEALVRDGAPTSLLQWLLRFFHAIKECCPVTELLQSLIERLTTGILLPVESVEKQRQQLSSLLDSIETLDLPSELCERVANLLPFLTYGQPSLSRELAQHIDRNIDVDQVGHDETTLTKTLIQMLIHLPGNDSCDKLRIGLLDCGLGKRLSNRLLRGIPALPPAWTTSLWTKTENPSANPNTDVWKQYYESAPILSVLLQMMIGLGRVDASSELVKALHWLEATSNSSEVETQGLGLLAETLLDNLVQVGDPSKQKIHHVRRLTRQRKKEIATEQRSKALAKMKFGNLNSNNVMTLKASKFTPQKDVKRNTASIPDWMAEADSIKEESGLTCAVCHEGRSLQPQEVLGLYAFVKKVSLMNDKCGSKDAISGISMLKRLPPSLPPSLQGSVHVEDWFSTAKVVSSELVATMSSRRTTTYTTSVSAGNSIHFSCHRRARSVDRSHPKAPKSEWSGAALRNNRVSCNIILPLVSPRSSNLLAIGKVESILAEYQTFVSNALESSPQSMLWSTLYDVYLLLLRIVYNEDLSADCGGGSLASNCELLYYQFIVADTFERDAQAENITHSTHARCLPCGLLAASALINEDGTTYNSFSPYVADAAPMAAICSVVFHNCVEASGSLFRPFPKRQWILGRDFFFRALILSAGRRHMKGVRGSGCSSDSSRRITIQDDPVSQDFPGFSSCDRMSVDSIAPFLHPMLVLFGVMDHISTDFSPSMSDEEIRESSQRLVVLLADCRKLLSVSDMMRRLNVTCRDEEMVAYFEKGGMSTAMAAQKCTGRPRTGQFEL